MTEYDLADRVWKDRLREDYAKRIRIIAKNKIVLAAYKRWHKRDLNEYLNECNREGICDDDLLTCIYDYLSQ